MNVSRSRRAKKRVLPPRTIRVCPGCKQTRTFKYNHRVGHSECMTCGARKIPTIRKRPDSSFSVPMVRPARTGNVWVPRVLPQKRGETIPNSPCPKCHKPIPVVSKQHKTCGWNYWDEVVVVIPHSNRSIQKVQFELSLKEKQASYGREK